MKKIPWFSLIYTSQLVSDFSVSCKNASIKSKEEEKRTRKLAKKSNVVDHNQQSLNISMQLFAQWRISDDIEHCFCNTFFSNFVLQHFFNHFFKHFFAIIIFATCFHKIFFATFLHLSLFLICNTCLEIQNANSLFIGEKKESFCLSTWERKKNVWKHFSLDQLDKRDFS